MIQSSPDLRCVDGHRIVDPLNEQFDLSFHPLHIDVGRGRMPEGKSFDFTYSLKDFPILIDQLIGVIFRSLKYYLMKKRKTLKKVKFSAC